MAKKVLRPKNLIENGVVGSLQSLSRVRKTDPSFPKAFEINGGIGFDEAEIDAWLAARPRIAKRDMRNPHLVRDPKSGRIQSKADSDDVEVHV